MTNITYKYKIGQKVDWHKETHPDAVLNLSKATVIDMQRGSGGEPVYHIKHVESDGHYRYWDVMENHLFPPAGANICTCDIQILMAKGCQCGHLVKE